MHMLGQQRIATGRTYEGSVVNGHGVTAQDDPQAPYIHVCYVKTLAAGRVLSDANERARSLPSMMNT
jgi:hypothetical protein